jgi:hypothetical protein
MPHVRLTRLSDDELIERLQQGAFAYLAAHANTDNGLIADTSRPGSPSSIAVVGMALTCYPVAVQRGWMTRRAAAALARTTLSFLWDSPQGEQPDASGYGVPLIFVPKVPVLSLGNYSGWRCFP